MNDVESMDGLDGALNTIMAEQKDNTGYKIAENDTADNVLNIKEDYLSSSEEPEFDFDEDDDNDDDDNDADDFSQLKITKERSGKITDVGAFNENAISDDGLIDEDFEKELGTAHTEEDPHEFSDAERLGFVEVAGDDLYGRKLIVIYACKLPSNKVFDQQRLLQYIKYTLDKYVEQDYVLVYFHHGLNSGNKPKLSWLVQAYREFDRKYKKNLKSLYLVHPTSFIKVVYKILRPVISAKFGRKIVYVNHLEELRAHVPFDQLSVPQMIYDFDAKKVDKKGIAHPQNGTARRQSKKTQQFGLSLHEIKQKTGTVIPLPVAETIEYMKAAGGDEIEGLFRRCAKLSTIKEVQQKYDNGGKVDFYEYSDPHLAAAILKNFLREIPEPLMTFDLFESITQLTFMDANKQVIETQKILQNELPEDNYVILKYIFQFLQKVVSKSDINQMTAENIAIVFGPNIAWPKGHVNLITVEHSVRLALILVKHFNEVFVR